jgi:hypothetical protein
LSVVTNPAGTAAPVTPTSGAVTPELAASLPYEELKQRMRAEARNYEEPATTETTTPDEGGEETPEAAVTATGEGAARDPETGRFTAGATTPTGDTTETGANAARAKAPATLEEAQRVIDAMRGNLNTATSERQALQRQVEEARQEAARQKAESEQRAMQAQHARFEELVSRLPAEQQGPARAEYVQRLQQQAVGEFAGEVQRREQAVAQREFISAKSEVPALYKDIARFVAEQQGVPVDELIAVVDSPHVKALIDSANTPQALQQASIAFGQMLDYEGTKLAGRLAAEKEARRTAKAGSQVRDMPNGVTAGGAQEDVVARINKMSPDEFTAYKKRLLRAAQQ